LTQYKNGDIYMSVPNYIDKRYAPVIMERTAKGEWSIFVQAFLNEKTGRADPMEIGCRNRILATMATFEVLGESQATWGTFIVI